LCPVFISHRTYLLTLAQKQEIVVFNTWPRNLYAGVALATLSTSALAQDLTFNLPAGPLASTLNAIAGQSGQIISLEPALVQGKRAPAVVGQMPAAQAMQKALSGSGLQLRVTGQGNFSVEPASDSSASLQLDATNIVERSLDATTTEGSGSYAARAVSIGKGTHTLKEIPQSVTVMTRKQMDDQDLVDLKDAVNKTTGLVGLQGVGKGMIITSRGFQIDDWQYDGVPIPRNTYGLGNWATQDLIFFDRLEILRGASGLLQGTGSPGGAINLVRKRGQNAPTVTITGKAGSWDHYGLQLDAGGPLNSTGQLARSLSCRRRPEPVVRRLRMEQNPFAVRRAGLRSARRHHPRSGHQQLRWRVAPDDPWPAPLRRRQAAECAALDLRRCALEPSGHRRHHAVRRSGTSLQRRLGVQGRRGAHGPKPTRVKTSACKPAATVST
jgi:outer membrane receptor protein involved in Fe transport